ncbi:hypothetical protein OAL33_00155 [Akkermansiaceae bacterium]|nr:hypothetical protein [Akkermansiaceae bacterium]MDA8967298.1 hypothetical protein [Akkermansiaceae bacterium]MDB0056294.1 hypothetical protein [Akkermansiaceae bacterium]MDB4041337.1 hypothetical protein [Akkermansiaceae bacterium]MDB4451847.1 hypothetical protein [Akkermansiaceae bacterium]
MNRYEIRFQSWNGSWCLSGPVGASGKLLFQTAREAASHARWDAEAKGGTIEVYDRHGQLFKTIEIEEKESVEVHSLLPSA